MHSAWQDFSTNAIPQQLCFADLDFKANAMQTSPMQTFSSNVRRVINEKGLTITELAESIGMHRQELSKILNGRVDPTTGTLQRVADGLNVQLWQLLKPHLTAVKKTPETVEI